MAFIGQLHNVLSTAPQQVAVNLGEHLHKMCSAMRPFVSLMGPVELFCDSDPDCMVLAEDIVPIALVASEMVTNAPK